MTRVATPIAEAGQIGSPRHRFRSDLGLLASLRLNPVEDSLLRLLIDFRAELVQPLLVVARSILLQGRFFHSVAEDHGLRAPARVRVVLNQLIHVLLEVLSRRP